jgi:hypothetical protein
MKPDICTSMLCDNLGCLYCKECSHAIFKGEGKDRTGKVWRWEYAPYYGVTFVGKKGEPLKHQPIAERHRAWQPFQVWYKDFKAKYEAEPRFEP